MGSGKSDIAAQAVECLQKTDKREKRHALAYYFCDKTKNDRAVELNDVGDILRCLLKQFLCFDCHTLWEKMHEEYEERRLHDRKLLLTEVQDFITQIAKSATIMTIIVDGADELSVTIRAHLLTALRTVQEAAGGKVRVLFASRFYSDLHGLIDDFKNLRQVAMSSENDIRVYVSRRLDKAFDARLLDRRKTPSLSTLTDILTSMAKGM